MSERLPIVHCLNTFFAGLGGEEAASRPPSWLHGAHGPGRLIEQIAPELEIVGTVVFGDDWMARDATRGAAQVLALVREQVGRGAIGAPRLLIAGPAFFAGRYGLACGAICAAARADLELPAVTAMYEENPGVEAYRDEAFIVPAAKDVLGMRDAIEALVRVGRKLVRGEALDPDLDGILRAGRRRNVFAKDTGACRAIDLLLRKLEGGDFRSEYPMPVFDRVAPAPALRDPGSACIALVSSGGIVPRGNPDRIESANAQRWASYEIGGLDSLSADTYQTVHGGYDPTYADQDPNRVLPLDQARALERDGRIGRLHGRYYVTVGNATEVARARRFGREIAARLVADGVKAVVLTST